MTMTCQCGSQAKCIDSRQRADHVYRRHSCKDCGERFTSLEFKVVEGADGNIELFDHPHKGSILYRLRQSILIALLRKELEQ